MKQKSQAKKGTQQGVPKKRIFSLHSHHVSIGYVGQILPVFFTTVCNVIVYKRYLLLMKIIY
jgi:hypothetical protein